MDKKSEGKKGSKRQEKKDTESREFEVSDDLTRKPLPSYMDKIKESKLYPSEALGKVKETGGEINEQESDDISDEETDSEGTDNIFPQSSKTTNTNKKAGPRKRLSRKSSTDAPKSTNKIHPKPNLQQQSKNISWKQLSLYGLFVIVSVIVLYFIYVSYTQSTTSTPALGFDAIISSLRPEFEKQPKMSFKVILTALKAVSKPEPKAPAIILLLAAEGAENQSRDLGQKLVKAVSPNFLKISGATYKDLDCNDGKKKIDDLLHSLSENKYDAVLVEDLHLIPGGTALMLHTYCDHENAPFKRTVYVMTVASGIEIPKDSSIKFWDEITHDRLNKSWSDLKDDQMAPLLARLTVGVAAITADN